MGDITDLVERGVLRASYLPLAAVFDQTLHSLPSLLRFPAHWNDRWLSILRVRCVYNVCHEYCV